MRPQQPWRVYGRGMKIHNNIGARCQLTANVKGVSTIINILMRLYDMIILLFKNGLKQKEISSVLASSGHEISERHMRRILKVLGLRRRDPQRPLTEIRKAVEAMMESGILELDNPVHINCLQYTHLPLLQKDLKTEQITWNSHDIRKQRYAAGPFGKPDVLYTSPPPGFADMLCPVDTDLLDYAKELVSEKDEPSMVANQEFRDMCHAILESSHFPNTADGCLAAYLMIVQEFTTAMNRNTIPTPCTFADANEIYKVLIRQKMGGE